MKKLPRARRANIVVQTLDDETLVYDLGTNKAYNLNKTSAAVYGACDGETNFGKLEGLSDEAIFLALDQLQKNDLLETGYVSPFAGLSRREAVKRAGLASMAALPVIAVLLAPSAATAQSNVCLCTTPGDCITQSTCPSSVNCNSGMCAP